MPIGSQFIIDTSMQLELSSMFWVVYIVAIIFSFVGVIITSKIRHDKEVKKIRKQFAEVKKDPSAVWPTEEEKKY